MRGSGPGPMVEARPGDYVPGAMKSSHSSFLDRRKLTAAALTVLLGGATALAQSTTSGSSTAGSTGSSGSGSSTSTRSDGAYGSSSSTTAPSTSGAVTPSSPNSSPDNTPRSEGSYGSGGRSSTSASGSISGSTGSTSRDTTSSTAGTSSTTATDSTTVSSTDTAGGATTMTGRDSAKLGWMERRWVNKVADSGMTEIALAKLAAEKASNPEVKSFAQKLVDDHTKVSEELKSLASQKNVKLDDEDLGSDRAHKRLSKKSGNEFDQEFIEHMVDMHEADVKLFEKASTDAKDSALKSFAAKHVDHLRQHLQQAQSLRTTIQPTGRTDSDSGSASTSGRSSGTTDATSGTAHQSGTSGTSGLTGTPGTTGGTSTDAGGAGATGSTSSGSSTSDTPRRDGSR